MQARQIDLFSYRSRILTASGMSAAKRESKVIISAKLHVIMCLSSIRAGIQQTQRAGVPGPGSLCFGGEEMRLQPNCITAVRSVLDAIPTSRKRDGDVFHELSLIVLAGKINLPSDGQRCDAANNRETGSPCSPRLKPFSSAPQKFWPAPENGPAKFVNICGMCGESRIWERRYFGACFASRLAMPFNSSHHCSLGR